MVGRIFLQRICSIPNRYSLLLVNSIERTVQNKGSPSTKGSIIILRIDEEGLVEVVAPKQYEFQSATHSLIFNPFADSPENI